MNWKSMIVCSVTLVSAEVSAERPNVVLVMTDDQGYGDVGCHGHPYVKTPYIDKLSSESVNLSDFHVFPTCSPTRAALMTGHWANRTGVWHTINGRSLLRKGEVTIASMLKDAGYQTGIFGKWHLGDGYPFRPEDRGFTRTFYHGAGGVGQTPDLWNNDYFTGSYNSNGKIEKADGFCTDVFFSKANQWIRKCAEEKKPFFAYIASNAPHAPLLAPQKYLDMYADKKGGEAAFYGMITNIDENVGKTRQLIEELGLTENTIFIYMTDNGSAHGSKVFNAGMQGRKNSEYDGGHRVPFMMYYPKGGIDKKREVKTLTHVVDLAPTLLEMTGSAKKEDVKFDGVSIAKLLGGEQDGLPDRYVVTDSQRVIDPVKWRKSAVMIQDWRLVNGEELYFMPEDPSQTKDLAKQNPEMLARLRGYYEEWWADLEPGYAETAEFIIGNENAKLVKLTSHDWIQKNLPPWNQSQVRQLKRNIVPKFEGYWATDIQTTGEYEVKLYRWAPDANAKIVAALPAQPDRPGVDKPYCAVPGKGLSITEVVFVVDGKEIARKPVGKQSVFEAFKIKLEKGRMKISPYFVLDDGMQVGVLYATFELAK